MTSAEERLRVLTMIEEGKITAEQGAQLLEALKGESGRQSTEAPASPGQPPRRLRIRVTNLETGQQKVNISMPWGLMGVGAKLGARFAPEDIDLDALTAAIEAGAHGNILDVIDEDDNERVEMFVE